MENNKQPVKTGDIWKNYIKQFSELDRIFNTIPEPLNLLLSQQIDVFAGKYPVKEQEYMAVEAGRDDMVGILIVYEMDNIAIKSIMKVYDDCLKWQQSQNETTIQNLQQTIVDQLETVKEQAAEIERLKDVLKEIVVICNPCGYDVPSRKVTKIATNALNQTK